MENQDKVIKDTVRGRIANAKKEAKIAMDKARDVKAIRTALVQSDGIGATDDKIELILSEVGKENSIKGFHVMTDHFLELGFSHSDAASKAYEAFSLLNMLRMSGFELM